MANPRVTVNEKLFREISFGLTRVTNELLEEMCKDRNNDDWFNHAPETWTESQKLLFDLLSEFEHRAVKHIEKTLLK